MKWIIFLLFVVLAVQVVAVPCDFAWNTPQASERCSTAPKLYGGILVAQYSAVGHNFELEVGVGSGVSGTGNAVEIPLFKTAYYTVKEGTATSAACGPPVGPATAAPNRYQWCPLTLDIRPGTTAYTFSNPSANNKWFNARSTSQPVFMQDVPINGEHFLQQDNFIALFMGGCDAACQIQGNVNFNSITGNGVTRGRWIVMPFNHCLEGETRSVGCDASGQGCTAAEFCNNRQWQAMTVSP